MGRVLVLIAALLLSACGQGGGREPFVDSRIPPGLSSRFFPPEGWAWGLIQYGDYPPQRYGVSAPRGAPQAHILILPGYGESAELWFETADDLNRAGFAVWVLDGAGQGGSGRFGGRRDIGHLPSVDPDLGGYKAMLRTVIPDDGAAVIVLALREGGRVALEASTLGVVADGLILSGTDRVAPPAPGFSLIGGLRILGQPGWKRGAPYFTGARPTDPRRIAMADAWQVANPDLRMGGPSYGYRSAQNRLNAGAAKALGATAVPTLQLGGDLTNACAGNCAFKPLPGSRYPHLDGDGPRGAWLAQVVEFVRQRAQEAASKGRTRPDHGE